MNQPLDYESPLGRPRGPSLPMSAFVLGVAVLAVNGALLARAAADRSWGALGVAFFVGPIANGVILIASLLCAPFVRSARALHVALAVAMPVGAIVLDFAIINAMGLHGC